MRKWFVSLMVVLLAVWSPLNAAQRLTVEDVLHWQYPREIAVNPDGAQIAYTVRTADPEKSAWGRDLWVFRSADGTVRQLTYGRGESTQPRWSPDGAWLAFLSDRTPRRQPETGTSGATQIWALPLAGGEAQQWTTSLTSIDAYRWAPDGRSLVYRTDQPQPAAVRARETRLEQLKFDATVKDSLRTNKVLYALDIATKNTRPIAVLDPGVRSFDIGPDGQWIVYETNYTGEYNDEQQYDLRTVNVATGETVQLTDFPGPETDPRFSPDGDWIAYMNQTTPDIEFAETDLARCRFRPGQAAQDTLTLTRDYDRAVVSYRWTGSATLALEIADGTETPVVEFRPDASSRRYRPLTPEVGNASQVTLPAGKAGPIYYLWEDADHLPEITVNRKGSQDVLTDFSRVLAQYQTGAIRKYRWKSVDGQELEGLLFLPPGFDRRKQYPLILTVHGGPYGRFRREYLQYYLPQLYTSDGYVVFAPNPRGSSGYGDAFGKAIWYQAGGHMGGIDYRDIMSGVDALIRDGFVDSTRMGVTGGSYGGYMTNWIISQTDRFRAAVSMYGIFSLFTDWSNSWQPAWEKMYLGIYYWEQPITEQHPYVQYSPAFHVKHIHTPVLIMHGTDDKYTNLSNSQEMYQALQTLGREVKFVVYPREGHGLSGEPNHRRDVIHRAKRWFDAHLRK